MLFSLIRAKLTSELRTRAHLFETNSACLIQGPDKTSTGIGFTLDHEQGGRSWPNFPPGKKYCCHCYKKKKNYLDLWPWINHLDIPSQEIFPLWGEDIILPPAISTCRITNDQSCGNASCDISCYSTGNTWRMICWCNFGIKVLVSSHTCLNSYRLIRGLYRGFCCSIYY